MERIKKALERARLEQELAPQEPPAVKTDSGGTTSMDISYTRTKVLETPREFLKSRRVVAGFDPGDYVDAYKVLRTRALQKLRENNWSTLAVTSPNGNEGKTVTAINLAISLAWEVNHTVLLVDANLRKPSVHEYFGFTSQLGLSDYLLDRVPLADLLLNPRGIPRFIVLPGGRPIAQSSEMLSSPKMGALVSELKQRYPSRLVIFDLPDLSTSDALAFAPYVDAMLLVVENGKTSRDALAQALDTLENTPVIGTVLNKADFTRDEG